MSSKDSPVARVHHREEASLKHKDSPHLYGGEQDEEEGEEEEEEEAMSQY